MKNRRNEIPMWHSKATLPRASKPAESNGVFFEVRTRWSGTTRPRGLICVIWRFGTGQLQSTKVTTHHCILSNKAAHLGKIISFVRYLLVASRPPCSFLAPLITEYTVFYCQLQTLCQCSPKPLRPHPSNHESRITAACRHLRSPHPAWLTQLANISSPNHQAAGSSTDRPSPHQASSTPSSHALSEKCRPFEPQD
jgi:hypothetical protein